MTIVHLVPDFISDDEYGAGNWKAAIGSEQALRQVSPNLIRVTINSSAPTSCLEQIPSNATDIYMEYSFFPELLTALRKHCPGARLHVRTVNAEALQFFVRNFRSKRDLVRPDLWKQTGRILWRDMRSRQLADSLAGISEWDDRRYWKLLPGRSPIEWVPYFSPWPHLRPDVEVKPWAERDRTVVSFGGNFDPSGEANFQNFDRLASSFPKVSSEPWTFVLTWWSKWHDRQPEVSNNVTIVNDLGEPWDLLCNVRALAVLTPYGFGFKTSIVDGLAAGCHVVVHSRLAPRVPKEVIDLCIVGDPAKPEDLARIARALVLPPTPHRLNEEFERRTVAFMKRRFTTST